MDEGGLFDSLKGGGGVCVNYIVKYMYLKLALSLDAVNRLFKVGLSTSSKNSQVILKMNNLVHNVYGNLKSMIKNFDNKSFIGFKKNLLKLKWLLLNYKHFILVWYIQKIHSPNFVLFSK